MPVTTRIISFLVGNPYKPSFPLLLGGGTTQGILYYSGLIPISRSEGIFGGGFRYYHLINQLLLHGWAHLKSIFGQYNWENSMLPCWKVLVMAVKRCMAFLHWKPFSQALMACHCEPQHLRCLWGFGSHMISRPKKPGVPYFPWNIACLIGILISWFIIIPI